MIEFLILRNKIAKPKRIDPKDLLSKEESDLNTLSGRFSVESELYKILEDLN